MGFPAMCRQSGVVAFGREPLPLTLQLQNVAHRVDQDVAPTAVS
jgi:hypothetical protein